MKDTNQIKTKEKKIEGIDSPLLHPQLIHEENPLNLVLKASGLGVYNWYPSKENLFWDNRMHELFGLALHTEEDISKYFFKAIHPESIGGVRQNFSNLFNPENKESNFEQEFMIIKNEETHHIKMSGVLFRNEHGEVHRVTGTCQDTTEVRKKELLLKSITEKLNEAQQIAKIGAFETQLDGRKIWWSEGMYTIFEVDPNLPPPDGLAFLSLVYPDDRESIMTKIATCIKEKTEVRFQYRLKFRDGRIKYMDDIARPIVDNKGWVTGINGTSKDITERRNIENNLRSSEERILMTTKAAKVGIWEWDAEADQLTWDDTMFDLYGLPKNRTPKMAEVWKDLVHPKDSAQIMQEFKTALKQERKFDSEFRLIRKDKSIQHIRTVGEVHRNEQGRAIRMIGVNWDITKEKEAKKQELRAKELEVKNRELEQFAYVASHDLREPLRTLKSFSELLSTRYGSKFDTKAKKYLGFISESASRMDEVVKSLLDYSRIGRKSNIRKINCQQLLNDLLIDLETLISESEAKFIISSLPTIVGYEMEFRMLLQNLISNALKFRRKNVKPVIEISVKNEVDQWVFCIKDNGIGIDSRYHQKIFVIFQQLHLRHEYEGTGIGLAHCKKIVDLFNGKIWLEAEPGKGSSFYFTVPVSDISH